MNTPHDGPLEEHLRGGSDLSRRYSELPSDDVPPELDSRVLAQAREAIEKTKRVRAWRKWTPPFALAASVLLAVSILLHSGVEREPLATAQVPQVASDVMVTTENPPANEAQVLPQAPAASEAATAPPKPAPVLPTPQPSEQKSASASVEKAERTLEEPIRQKLQLQAPQVRVESRSAAPPPSVAFEADGEQSKQRIEDEPRPAVSSSLGAVQADELKKAVQNVNADDVAERWLTEIRKLRTAGKTTAANREWQKFRETFPDYEVAEGDLARPAASHH